MINLLERYRTIPLILTILAAIEIFVFSSLTFAPGKGITSIAIIYHFVIFFLFSFFLFITIKGGKKIKIRHILIVFAISLIYAISDEIHQSFIPGRNANVEDILTDLAGSITSMIIYLFIQRKNKKFS